jgi:hypothetical protein
MFVIGKTSTMKHFNFCPLIIRVYKQSTAIISGWACFEAKTGCAHEFDFVMKRSGMREDALSIVGDESASYKPSCCIIGSDRDALHFYAHATHA